MRPKKILHIVEDLGIGGLEKVVAAIAIGLDKKKYEIEVWCLTKGGDIADQLISKNINLKILGMNSYHNPFQIIKLFVNLKKSKFDIIHSHGYFASTFGRLAALLAGIPIKITHVHTTDFGFKKRNILIERLLSIFTFKIICVSDAVKQYVETYVGINNKKTCLIYNGCYAGNLAKSDSKIARSLFGFSKENFIIITVGSLVQHKGHCILIDAVKILEKQYANLRLLIVGDGPLSGSIHSYIRKLQLTSKIILTGKKENVFGLLNLADIFVLASIEREGLGIALIEAMASGLPLIGSRLGGIPEVINHDVNGLLVRPGKPYELAESIEKIILNREMANKFGKQGKEIFKEKFTTHKMTRNLELLYDRII